VKEFYDNFKDCIVYLAKRIAPVNQNNQMISPGTITKEKFSVMQSIIIIENLKFINADAFLIEDDLKNCVDSKDTSSKIHLATLAYLFHNFSYNLSSTSVQLGKLYSMSGECLDEYVCSNFLKSFDIQHFTNNQYHHNNNNNHQATVDSLYENHQQNNLALELAIVSSSSHPFNSNNPQVTSDKMTTIQKAWSGLDWVLEERFEEAESDDTKYVIPDYIINIRLNYKNICYFTNKYTNNTIYFSPYNISFVKSLYPIKILVFF